MVQLETPRLCLRQLTPKDLPAILDFIRRNRAFHAPYEPVRPETYFGPTYWKQRIRTESRDATAGRSLRLYLHLKEAPRLIGYLALDNMIRGAGQACALGYMLDETAQGKGLMTEALKAATRYAFEELNLHRIVAGHILSNRRSGRVLERSGFRREGRARAFLRIAGRWQDHIMWAKINPRWRDPTV